MSDECTCEHCTCEGPIVAKASEPLEDVLLIVETKLSETLQAELSTIKGDIAELKAFVQEVREFTATMSEQISNNPAIAALMGGGGFGSGFGFN